MSDFFIPGSFVIYSPLASPPASPRTGWLWLVTDSANRRLRYYDGSAWQDLYVDPTWAPGAGAAILKSGRASRSTSLSCTNGTVVTVTFDTSDYDSGGYINIGSHPTRITITNTGVYLFVARSIYPSNNQFWRSMQLLQNGATTIWSAFYRANDGVQTDELRSWMEPLAAADYVELQLQQGSGSTLAVTGISLAVTRVS